MRIALVLAAGIALGCSPDTHSASPPRADLETLRAALTQRDELERTYLFTSYLRALAPEDPAAALAEMERLRVGISTDEVRLFMIAWMRFDAPGAFAAARDWPTAWRDVLTEQAMRAWGFSDGRAALAEWERIEDEELQKSLLVPLVNGWTTSHDREGVTEYVAMIEEPLRRNRLALRLAGEAMRDGPDATLAWAESVPTDAPNKFKATVFVHAAGAVSRVDPERAARFYEQHINQPYTRLALRNLARGWAKRQDARSLVEWIESLPFEEAWEEERLDGLLAAFRIWSADAPRAAEAWLESASPGPSRDVAIEEFVRATIDESPAAALVWVGRIEDVEERRKRTIRSAREWRQQDPEAAQAWLAQADISSGWREQILKDQQRRRLGQPGRDAGRMKQAGRGNRGGGRRMGRGGPQAGKSGG